MNRRGFLGAILAAGIAPVIIKASSLMSVKGIQIPTLEEVMYFASKADPLAQIPHVINTGHFTKALWPGVNAWYGKQYANLVVDL